MEAGVEAFHESCPLRRCDHRRELGGRARNRARVRSHGATIGLLARGEEGLEACAEEVRSLGGHPVVLITDVAESEQVQSAAERLEREHGPIDDMGQQRDGHRVR